MSRTKTERNGNGAKCEVSVWTRAITANSEWPDKVNITPSSRAAECPIAPSSSEGGNCLRPDVPPRIIFTLPLSAGGISRRDILGETGDRYYRRYRMGPYTTKGFYSSVVVSRGTRFGSLLSSFSNLRGTYASYLCFRFVLVNAGITYLYFSNFQQIDEEEYGGMWELTKEGFMTSFAGFLVRATILL